MSTSTRAAELRDLPGTLGTRLNLNIQSLKEIRYRNTVRQQYDFSCGGAALAMIMRYQYGLALSEEQIVQSMLINGDKERIQKNQGFSLLDLKRYANAVGFNATGYKLSLNGVQALGLPAIIPVKWKGYHHFVVFRGYDQGRVFLADPAWGNLTMTEEEFESTWQDGVAFVISPRNDEIVINRMAVKPEEMLFVKDEHLAQLVRHTVFVLTSRR